VGEIGRRRKLDVAFAGWEGVRVRGVSDMAENLFILFDCCSMFAFLIKFGDGRPCGVRWKRVVGSEK
jgi:hypothetical protein